MLHSPPRWAQVHSFLSFSPTRPIHPNAFEQDCTAKAISHRIAKIKNDCKASANSATPSSPAVAASSPAKRNRAATKTAPKTPVTKERASRRAAAVKATNYAQSGESNVDDDEEDQFEEAKERLEDGESPSKKVKQEFVQGEEEGEDGF